MLKWAWISIVTVALDQATKLWIVGTMRLYDYTALLPGFNLVRIHNAGAAFSFLSEAGGWQRWFFSILAIIASIVLSIWLARLQKKEILLAIALSLVLGGAIGNVIDRIFYGYVIDFIDIYYKSWHWPAFNIADSAITLGVGLILLESFIEQPKK